MIKKEELLIFFVRSGHFKQFKLVMISSRTYFDWHWYVFVVVVFWFMHKTRWYKICLNVFASESLKKEIRNISFLPFFYKYLHIFLCNFFSALFPFLFTWRRTIGLFLCVQSNFLSCASIYWWWITILFI